MNVRGNLTTGTSYIELLIGLAVLGILFLIGLTFIKPPEIRLLTNDIALSMQTARFEAIKRNRPVAVLYDGKSIELRANPTSLGASCAPGQTQAIRRMPLNSYGKVPQIATSLSTVPDEGGLRGMLWLPSGQTQRCDSGGFFAGSLTVSGHGTALKIVVSSAGRVQVRRAS